MKQFTILIYSVFFGALSFGQQTKNLNDSNNLVLYRGFPNHFEVIGPTWENELFTLNCISCKVNFVSTDENLPKQEFIIYPESGRQAILEYIRPGKDTIRQVFEVRNLPDPNLYLNGVESGAHIDKSNLLNTGELIIAYPPKVTLTSNFHILNWEFADAGLDISGYGSILSDESLAHIQGLKSGTAFSIIVTVQCSSGIARKKSATYTLN